MQPNDWRRVTRALSEADMERQRAELAKQINAECTSGVELDVKVVRARLEKEHGQVWDSYELGRDFDIEAFSAPLVCVTRRSDGAKGTLVYQHHPRFYWGFEPA